MKIKCLRKGSFFVASMKAHFHGGKEYEIEERMVKQLGLLEARVDGLPVFEAIKEIPAEDLAKTPEEVHHDAREKRLDKMEKENTPIVEKRKAERKPAKVIEDAKVEVKDTKATTRKRKAAAAGKGRKKAATKTTKKTTTKKKTEETS